MKLTGHLRAGTMILVAFLLLSPTAYPCSWVVGYFHQVTRLRGTVVGVKNGDLRHPFRFLRQHAVVGQAKLTLYAYPLLWEHAAKNPIVKQVVADDHGGFDFSTIPVGHYTLLIASPWGEDMFDVEIVQQQKSTKTVTIDVSPNYPDCTGGHEFISVQE